MLQKTRSNPTPGKRGIVDIPHELMAPQLPRTPTDSAPCWGPTALSASDCLKEEVGDAGWMKMRRQTSDGH